TIAVRNGTLPGRRVAIATAPLPFGGLDEVPARNIHHPSRSDRTNATEYVVNVSLTFGDRGDAEQAEMQLATTIFNGLVSSWSEVEEVSW
ncbi:MAG TPA: hypothetical protein VED43_10490, partial [Mycobacterium sp.]|nr:hypothetical protein [Mycobacterium sp.]